jgi:ABC-type polysaccharide/polyol phosphate export permease
LELNPMTGIIGTFRAVAGGAPFDAGALAGCTALTLGLLLFALWTFRRMERVFADVI